MTDSSPTSDPIHNLQENAELVDDTVEIAEATSTAPVDNESNGVRSRSASVKSNISAKSARSEKSAKSEKSEQSQESAPILASDTHASDLMNGQDIELQDVQPQSKVITQEKDIDTISTFSDENLKLPGEDQVKEPGKLPAIASLLAAVLSAGLFVAAFTFFVLIIAKTPGFDERIADQTPRGDDRINFPMVDFAVPMDAVLCAIAGGFLALTFMFILIGRVLLQPVGVAEKNGGKMYLISLQIAAGARSFLLVEGIILSIFVVVVFCVLLIIYGILYAFDKTAERGIVASTPVCFLAGAITSGLTAVIGMTIATSSNVRTAHAARVGGLEHALHVAFDGGSVMGMAVIGLAVGVLSIFYLIFRDLKALNGFGFGASAIALFARVGGGIFTKAADVGADLVGKVEAGIPEDDPRNPAVIADNVGDNVGDVAGMGSDLFESFAGTIIAAATLGGDMFQQQGVALPFFLAASGILCSIIGSFFVSTGIARFIPFPKTDPNSKNLQTRLLWAMRKGIIVAASLNVLAAGGIIFSVFHDKIHPTAWCLYVCYILGLLSGVLIGFCTELFTADVYPPVKAIARSGLTGSATVVIKGLSVGMLSTAPPVIILGATILGCMYLGDYAGSRNPIIEAAFGKAGVYGISIAAMGMLSTLGVTLATDAYGPVADNAGGIAEMSGLPEEVRQKTDALDSLGNTTAATGKGFSIGSAVLTALALMNSFTRASGIGVEPINVLEQRVVLGLLIGGLLPFVFSALTMDAVNKCAMEVIKEVRRQFRTIEGLMEFKAHADHATCVAICTRASLREMIIPGSIAVVVPVVVGFAGRQEMLAGLLAGSIITGFLLAVTMSNAGGAWDNAKKMVEAKGLYDPETDITHFKRSEVHKACVVGDTIGDPFKDVSGPSLNVLIKLMTTTALIIAPFLKAIYSS